MLDRIKADDSPRLSTRTRNSKLRTCAWALVVLLTLVGCQALSLGAPALKLQAQLSMQADGQAVIRIGATNAGLYQYPENDNFGGVMELRNAAGELRSKIEVHKFAALKPNQTDMPTELKAQLDPGMYRLTWSAPSSGRLTLEFDVLEREGQRFLRADPRYIQPFTEYTIAEPRG